jgi:hypothetical protein
MRALPALAKIAFAAFAASLIVGLVASFGTRLGVWDFQTGVFRIFPWCVYIGAAGLALGLAWLIASRISGNSESARYGWIGLIGAAAVLALPLYSAVRERISPPIHDITTDVEDPPPFIADLALRKGAPNPASYDGDIVVTWKHKTFTTREWQRKEYGDVHTIAILTPPEKLFERALDAARSMGWNIVAVVPDQGRIEATDTSFFFGFTDDIVIRVKPAGIGGRLDIRSKSRVGTSDNGKNAARIRRFIKDVVSGLAG